jgi:hypothetical protein
MKFHFTLEYKRLRRQIEELGFHPTPVFLVSALLFLSLAFYVGIMTEKPSLLIVLAGAASISLAFRKKRTSFYRGIYSRKEILKIQSAEASLLAFPFFLILLSSGFFMHTFLLFGVVILSPFLFMMSQRTSTTLQMPPVPTPFKKHPFEFIQGFRTIWPLYLVVLFVIYKAVQVDNFNLGLVSFLIALISMAFFFTKPEPISFVTIYVQNAKGFLWQKMKLAARNMLLLSLPFIILLLGFFPDEILLVTMFMVFGLLFTLTSLLGKYAYFPIEMNVIQSIALGLCLMIPPLVIIVIPVFYKKALANLNPLLS